MTNLYTLYSSFNFFLITKIKSLKTKRHIINKLSHYHKTYFDLLEVVQTHSYEVLVVDFHQGCILVVPSYLNFAKVAYMKMESNYLYSYLCTAVGIFNSEITSSLIPSRYFTKALKLFPCAAMTTFLPFLISGAITFSQ